MTKQEFDKLYKGKVVHCNTLEKANHFLKLAHSVGYKWISNRSLLDVNNWVECKEKTGYHVDKYGLKYEKIDWHYEYGYEIVEYQPQPKFKIGEKVILVDGVSFLQGKEVTITDIRGEMYEIKSGQIVTVAFEKELKKIEYVEKEEAHTPQPKFNIGDVVYNEQGTKVTIIEIAYLIKYSDKSYFFIKESQLFTEPPLKEITIDEANKILKEKGLKIK